MIQLAERKLTYTANMSIWQYLYLSLLVLLKTVMGGGKTEVAVFFFLNIAV